MCPNEIFKEKTRNEARKWNGCSFIELIGKKERVWLVKTNRPHRRKIANEIKALG